MMAARPANPSGRRVETRIGEAQRREGGIEIGIGVDMGAHGHRDDLIG
jgi:hypothetical protein